jgi:hypothetical protein
MDFSFSLESVTAEQLELRQHQQADGKAALTIGKRPGSQAD